MNEMYIHAAAQRSILTDANTEYLCCGRGWAKTETKGAIKTATWANNMPRAAIGVVAPTYMKMLNNTLPPLYRGWERLGYKPGIHFWKGAPHKRLNIPSAYYAPDTDKYVITWWNGACFVLISQDRPGSANGKTLDAIYVDESKFINKKKFDEEIGKTNRGNIREFGDYAGHHGEIYMTDMPTDPGGKWILEKQLDMNLSIRKGDKVYKMRDLINLIINYQLHLNQLLTLKYRNKNTGQIGNLNRQIRSSERILNELRKQTVNYTSGPSHDNIHFLGLDTLKKWKRDDLDVVFRTQVLNQPLYEIENGFYAQLDLEHHTYDKHDYHAIDNGDIWLPDGVRQGCMNDGDLIRSQPLDLAMDAGARINCMVVGQELQSNYRVLKALYVKHPKRLLDVLEDFCTYYESFKTKVVNFHYDHTFVGTDATRVYSYADEIHRYLSSKGWHVNMINIGQQPGHESRYRMWGSVLKEDGKLKPIQFNRTNCEKLLISMQCAGVLQGSKGIQKDKRPEKRSDVPQEEATHFTDALDTLYIGKFQTTLGYAPAVTEAFFE